MHPWRGRSRPPQPDLPLRDPDAVLGERHPQMVACESFFGRPVRRFDGVRSEVNDIGPSAWGRAWERHVSRFRDLERLLDEARTRVENGLVWHLQIDRAEILGIVLGSQLYAQKIAVEPLSRERERRLMEACQGRVSESQDLLAGRLDAELMAALAAPAGGLLPSRNEMRFTCSCGEPMPCKHVAAVLFAVAVRLGERPIQLYVLRGTDPVVLKGLLPPGLSQPPPAPEKLVAPEQLAEVFDLRLDRRLEPPEPEIARPQEDPLAVFLARPKPEPEPEPAAATPEPAPEPPRPIVRADEAAGSWLDEDWDDEDEDEDDMDTEVFGGPGPSPVSVSSTEDGEDMLEIGRTDLLDLGIPSHRIQRWLADGTLLKTSKRGRYQLTPEAWSAIEPLLPSDS